MSTAAADRVVSLDLIRGVAVLGILAVNIAGFAGPSAATLTPHVPHAASFVDEAAYAAVFVVFEGKMRALFTMLFGASLLLFIDHAEARGRNGTLLQLRRLGWLGVFGLAHYFLFWWGDILFLYAVAGAIALFLRRLPPRSMLLTALFAYGAWHLAGAVAGMPQVTAEERVRLGTASAAQAANQARFLDRFHERAASELAEYRRGFVDQVAIKLRERPLRLIETTTTSLGETLPLMLLGMVLLRSGFFTGRWPRGWLVGLAAGGGALGAAATLALLGWLWPRHFPPMAMSVVLLYAAALPHLLMALAYAALFVLATPRLVRSPLGQRLTAAGRLALSNYIGTSVMMTAIFYGWGLGLVGRLSDAAALSFVLLGWAAMLGWSRPWLDRFGRGPLEWLWRALTERRPLPLRS